MFEGHCNNMLHISNLSRSSNALKYYRHGPIESQAKETHDESCFLTDEANMARAKET